jgi:hypothetical protein
MNWQRIRRVVLVLSLICAAACASRGVRCDGHLQRINTNSAGAPP